MDQTARPASQLVMLGLLGAALLFAAPAGATSPASVTIVGSLQSELGCGGDWDPTCAATHLTYDANDDVWQGPFSLLAGNWEYKAALDDAWTVNYGLHATPDGANIPLNLAASTTVKFFYDDKTHWVTDNVGSVIATAAGSYQSELGCSGDWDPGCLRSWLEDPDGDGIYTFSTTALPPGSYDAKVAINESWTENYGQGGTPDGANIPFTVPAANTPTVFSYDSTSHVLTISFPHLSLSKSAAPTTFHAEGEVIGYTLVATNDGISDLTGVSISDPMLGQLSCVPSQPATLTVGASLTCTGSHTITADDVTAGAVANSASASGTAPGGSVTSAAPAGASVTYVPPIDLLDVRAVTLLALLLGAAGAIALRARG